MWIRSQNKYTLINTNVIRICEDDRDDFGDYLICGYSDGYDHELGVYSTLEKAFKVLDEIRNELNDAQYYEIENNGHGMYTLNTGIRVYRMPDDEDVEV